MVTETRVIARLDRRRSPTVTVTRPAARYGAPRPWARPLAVGVAVLLAVVGGGWVLWAGLHHAQQPPVAGQLVTYSVYGDAGVSATIGVHRKPGVGAVCLLLAQADDHLVVGERQVRIPPGPQETLTRTYRIRTERPATNAVLDRCVAQR
jgi:hypothetical protein